MKVLIVDDSITFRSAVKQALTNVEGLEIVGVAANGKIALAKLASTPCDLVTLDLEMPEMDGIETLKAIALMPIRPKVIVFAAPTTAAYERVMQAMKAGAIDFVAKPKAEASDAQSALAQAIDTIRNDLVPRITQLLAPNARGDGPRQPVAPAAKAPPPPTWERRRLRGFVPQAIVIASSTGGPLALEKLLSRLRPPLRQPILIAQHMPPPFTKTLADRLGVVTGCPAAEGRDGERLKPGQIYVAPADYHMLVERDLSGVKVILTQGDRVNFVRPAADLLFTSAARAYRQDLMAFVLTGMGEDGRVGCGDIKNAGGAVMIQDQETSVVWGMPGAVHALGAYDAMGSIDDCNAMITEMACA